MKHKTSLYHQLLDIAFQLSSSVSAGKVKIDSTNGATYASETLDADDYYLRDAVAIMDLTLFDNLPAHACKYLLALIKQIKRNNVFYTTTGDTANERRSIASLKRAKILLPTERRNLFIINPFKLRRGKPLATIMASLHAYQEDNSILMIKDLQPPRKALIGITSR